VAMLLSMSKQNVKQLIHASKGCSAIPLSATVTTSQTALA